MEKDPGKKDDKSSENAQIPGYPAYPASEDVYTREKKESYDETEDSILDAGLDVPGAELDDADELIGEEDEENNYYSLRDGDYNELDEK